MLGRIYSGHHQQRGTPTPNAWFVSPGGRWEVGAPCSVVAREPVAATVHLTSPEPMPDLDVNENSDVYYQGGYWNDFDMVVRRINERVSGDPLRTWSDHFAKPSVVEPLSGR